MNIINILIIKKKGNNSYLSNYIIMLNYTCNSLQHISILIKDFQLTNKFNILNNKKIINIIEDLYIYIKLIY